MRLFLNKDEIVKITAAAVVAVGANSLTGTGISDDAGAIDKGNAETAVADDDMAALQ